MMTFAENLRRLRVERFLSQRELARQAGVHAITVVRLEAGATAPSTRSVRALAAVLNVEPRDLTTPEEVAELRRVLTKVSQAGAESQVDHHADQVSPEL
jgi:transcriptional regulator with XRE-family HTH domain